MSSDLVPSLNISSSALNAERLRMKVAANNMANAQSATGADGKPYRRQSVVFEAVMGDAISGRPGEGLGGVKVSSIEEDQGEPKRVYAPYHPNADQTGMVDMPNISPMEEMMDMMTASRAYEANLTAIKRSRKMAEKAIDLLKA
jgi:flagellar basal-body rod protein FlgC